MVNIGIAFEWQRDTKGYRLELGERDEPSLIVRKGGKLESFRPLEIAGLYATFARVTGPEPLLAFVSKFGPLSKAGSLLAPSNPRVRTSFGRTITVTDEVAGENVREALVHASWFRKVLVLPAYSDEQKRLIASPKPLKLSEGRLVSDADGYRIEYRPRTLLDAMRLQLALALVARKTIKYCAHCNEPFELGVGTAKRADASFCSAEHRVRSNSLKRTKR